VIIAGVVVLLLVLAQFILPAIAVKLVRDRAGKYGDIKSAHISAFPAIELLWGKAESATMTAGHMSVTQAQLTELTKQLWQARGVEKADISADEATVHLNGLAHGLTALHLHATKQGSRIDGSATVSQQALDEAMPNGFHVQPVASENGQVEVKASGGLFGVNASIGAVIKPEEGHLVAEPQGIPFAALGSITLISDQHIDVESVGLELVQRQPATYKLSFGASLR
jgi:hypothetical protein